MKADDRRKENKTKQNNTYKYKRTRRHVPEDRNYTQETLTLRHRSTPPSRTHTSYKT